MANALIASASNGRGMRRSGAGCGATHAAPHQKTDERALSRIRRILIIGVAFESFSKNI
ncbi:hypothetical protein X946_4798 [Burkholderia sp. ABCPW 111]|nr:hypothetical protein X946_4798 [Burkholderia sp. ABCPW 111]